MTVSPIPTRRRWRRALRGLVAGTVALVVTTGPGQASAADATPAEPAPAVASADPWQAASPTVFGVGDSLFRQCGNTLGLGTRSLGIVGWPSATSGDLRARLSSPVEAWPWMTEPSHAEELADFRDAGTLVIGLGTNDVRRPVAEFRSNVTWFLQQAAGRPVLWFNVHHPQHPTAEATINGVLADAAQQWPNLRILDWKAHVTAHPEVLHRDRLHLASYEACRQGRFSLIQASVPAVAGQEPSPDWTDPEPQPPPTPDPVSVEWERTGGAGGLLGAPTGDLSCSRRGDGCARFYEGGGIAWSPATGAHVLAPPVTAVWRDTGEISGPGYPTGPAVCGLSRSGCRQPFEHGWMYWSATTPAFQLSGPHLAAYQAQGAEGGALGYPTTAMACGLAGGGCGQHFAGGSIYWSATTGAQPLTGAVRSRWLALGGAGGRLGYPTIPTACYEAGCGQHFTGGSIYWSPGTGARQVTGAVRSRWIALGASRSALGFPRMDTACGLAGGGCGQHFTGGSIYWSPTTGARVVAGVVRARWLALGGAGGRYGYPVGDRIRIAGGVKQRFQGGTLTYRDGRWV